MNKSSIFFILFVSTLFYSGLLNATGGKGGRNIPKSKVVFISKHDNVSLAKLPKKSKKIEYQGSIYYFGAGKYYVEQNEKYVEVHAPIGIRIKKIPQGYQRIIRGGYPYYFSKGNFYVQTRDRKAYIVVNGPVGCEMNTLPENAREIKVDKRPYYLVGINIFEKTGSRNRDFYKLIGHLSE